MSSEANPEQLVEAVLKSIDFKDINQKNEFKQMIRTLFIDENNQLFLFHPQTLYYINTVENENRKLAEFLFAVLWNGKGAWEISNEEHQTDDLMSSLIFKALPELKSEELQPLSMRCYYQKYRNYLLLILNGFLRNRICLLNNLRNFYLTIIFSILLK